MFLVSESLVQEVERSQEGKYQDKVRVSVRAEVRVSIRNVDDLSKRS